MTQAHTMTNAHLLTWVLPPVVEVFIFTLSVFSIAKPVQGSSVSCNVTPVEPLTNTSVRCYFPEDVSQTRRIVTISHFKGNNYQDEEDVLDCWWMSGIMDCVVNSGYKFNRIISRELTLEIPRVSSKQVGNYACKLSNMNPRDIKPCELKITLVGKTMCDVPSIKDTSLTCYFPEDLSKTKANFSVHHDVKGDVMSCVWKGDNLNCMNLPGYEFDYRVTDHAIVRIPNASEEHEGTYTCQITGLGSVRYDYCSLAFEKAVALTSSCQITSVYETEPTLLTCSFSVDVIATRRNIRVVRFSDRDSKGVDITNCSWLKDQLNCTTASGYEIRNTVSNHIVIRVPRASRGHNGTYVCHVTGFKMKDFEPCDFIVMTGLPDGGTRIIAAVVGSAIFVIIIIIIIIAIRFWKTRKIVELACTYPPRFCDKLSWTGECFIGQITLFPEQVELLNKDKASPRLFVAGPPGTGKTVVLLLMGTEWLRNGNDVYIVSTSPASLPVCLMLHRMMLQGLKTKKRVRIKPGQPILLEITMSRDEDVERAVDTLSQNARKGLLYVIADVVFREENFKTFCTKLHDKVSRLHLWASSYYHKDAPEGWRVEFLARPIRSPPDVVKEVEQDKSITTYHNVNPYSERDVTDRPDGPPVIRLYHRVPDHPGGSPVGCLTCGCEVAKLLHSLHQDVPEKVMPFMAVTSTRKDTASPSLQWRDILVLYASEIPVKQIFVKQLKDANIPAQVMTDDDTQNFVMAKRNVVFVADGQHVLGLERRVVVVLDPINSFTRLYCFSRCMSQLVIVSTEHQ